MEWWNNFTDWINTDDGRNTVFIATAIVVALIVGALIAALIAKGAIRRLLHQLERERKSAAIAALVDAATEASVWNSLTPQEQVLSDRAVGQADITVRLLPIKGSSVAASWASHQLAELKRNSSTYGYQLDPVVVEFRDRLVEWMRRPARAAREFQSDLNRWASSHTSEEQAAINQQDQWVSRTHHEQYAASQARSAPSTAPTAATPVATSAPTVGLAYEAAPVSADPAQQSAQPASAASPDGLVGAANVNSAGPTASAKKWAHSIAEAHATEDTDDQTIVINSARLRNQHSILETPGLEEATPPAL